MLKNKEGLLITVEECRLIEAINCDNESGRHLLGNRSDDYWKMRNIIYEAIEHLIKGDATEKQKQIVEYQKQSSDYSYWKKLPYEKKMFIEVED